MTSRNKKKGLIQWFTRNILIVMSKKCRRLSLTNSGMKELKQIYRYNHYNPYSYFLSPVVTGAGDGLGKAYSFEVR